MAVVTLWCSCIVLSLFAIGGFFFLSRVYKVSVTLETDHADTVQIYLNHSHLPSQFKEILPHKKTTLTFNIPVISINQLRIDPGERSGVFKIYRIVITQDLGREIILDYKDIYSAFQCVDKSSKISLEDTFVLLSSRKGDLQMIAQGVVRKSFPVFLFLPISIISFFFYRVLSRGTVESFTTFFLPQRERPSSNTSVIQALDGLRGFAILLVVAEHTLHSFIGAGRSGVFIFFALSGFLLVRPYVDRPTPFFRVENILHYIERRLERIFPLFLVYLLLVYIISLRLGDFLLHAFFIKGMGHIWTLPQEMLFYIFFPFILGINSLVLRNNLLLIVLFLLTLIFGWYHFLSAQEIYLYGMFYSKLPFMLPSFLSGTFFSYIYYRVLVNIMLSRNMKFLLSIVAISIALFFVFLSNAQLFNSREIYSFTYKISFGICAAILIPLLIMAGNNFLTSFFTNRILSSIGVVSYGLYLFHPLVINVIKKFGCIGYFRFFIVLIISYMVACATYHFIEIPVLKKCKTGK